MLGAQVAIDAIFEMWVPFVTPAEEIIAGRGSTRAAYLKTAMKLSLTLPAKPPWMAFSVAGSPMLP